MTYDSPAATTGFTFVTIPTPDGVNLTANVDEPTTPGPHPAIVFISSWGLNDLEYLAQAGSLATSGYTVVSYTPRGFWGSGGTIQTAGPADIADVSTVITWMLAHEKSLPVARGTTLSVRTTGKPGRPRWRR